jgi:hypothetical protein
VPIGPQAVGESEEENASAVPTAVSTTTLHKNGNRNSLEKRELRLERRNDQPVGRQIGSRKSGTRRRVTPIVTAKLTPVMCRD